MISIRPIFQGSFWFDLFPTALSPVFERGFFFFFAAFVFVGAALRMMSRKAEYDRDQKKVMRLIAVMLTTMGIAGLVWLFFTFQEVYFLGARFWFLVWLGATAYWIYRLVRYVRVELPAEKEARNLKQEVNAYLPKKRRRKGKK